MVRAPDDPGVDDDEAIAAASGGEEAGQEGGWRGFLSRVTR